MIGLIKKPKATNFSDNRAASFFGHTAKIVTRILRGRIERIIEDELGENQDLEKDLLF
jgi:hypothetical protein